MKKISCFIAFVLVLSTSIAQADLYNLNVQIIQVGNDAGSSYTNLGPSGGMDQSYLYMSQVNDIFAQASIQVTYLPIVQWDNTEAQRLTSTERGDIYGNTFTSTSGDALPGLATDAVQIFFVNDLPGTGYTGTGTGWVDNPLPDPESSARNAGNAQLYIDGTFSSNGRSVMANEGFAANSLSGTLAHEMGHLLGLRHVEDVNGGAGNGTTKDPNYMVAGGAGFGTPNLMWGAGMGPGYDNMMTVAPNNLFIQEQIDAMIFNGLRLDPDGNGIGVLQAIPEPSSLALLSLTIIGVFARRRRM